MNIASNKVQIKTNENGMQFFHVATDDSTCIFTNYGAHIISFAVNGNELLWVSEKSFYQQGKAIRGGIPVCWPYFGAAEIAGEPAHGYARLNEWEVQEITDIADGRVKAKLTLNGSKLPDYCKNLTAELEIIIGKTLQVSLTTFNRGNYDFKLSQALHSYFNVSNISNIEVKGLEDTEYFDSLTNQTLRQQGAITFDSEVDRVYLDTEAPCTLVDKNKSYQLQITKSGSASTVVWNPWIDKARRMADFGDDEYLNMVCIETVNAKTDSRILKANTSHTLKLEFIVL